MLVVVITMMTVSDFSYLIYLLIDLTISFLLIHTYLYRHAPPCRPRQFPLPRRPAPPRAPLYHHVFAPTFRFNYTRATTRCPMHVLLRRPRQSSLPRRPAPPRASLYPHVFAHTFRFKDGDISGNCPQTPSPVPCTLLLYCR